MRRLFQISSIVVISLIIGSITHARAQSSQGEAPLTNAAVVKLAKAGFKEKTIISIIAARLPRFDLSPDRMIELKKNGVSEKIIVAMLARQEGMSFDDDSWGDDPFYSGNSSSTGIDPKSDPGNSKTQDNSVNIFGNSGGSKSQTRSRGGNGNTSGDTVTTGSATVRILRPPTEAGNGTPARLEKAKTLTNDSIVELVEAGFSEGTIIRRIEQSPVDFDLAPAKIEDLRKRRVGDKILSAMKAAMGDESAK
jgi:hypothetical protein